MKSITILLLLFCSYSTLAQTKKKKEAQEVVPPPPQARPIPEPIIYPDDEIQPPDSDKQEVSPRNEDEIVEVPDTAAEFIGGNTALLEFIKKNLKYPQIAIENAIEGNVYLSFVVEKNGAVSSVKVLRSVHESLDQEAIRIVKSMPSWKPAILQNAIVRSRVIIPIRFRIN